MRASQTPGPLTLEAGRQNPFEQQRLRSWTLLADNGGYWPTGFDVSATRLADEFLSSITTLANSIVVSFESIARFEISFERKTVTAFDLADETDGDALAHLLFDHVAPRILAHEGALVLHASAVAIDGKVAIFLGETGAGKSTLSACLHQAGHQLLGDDAIIISHNAGCFFAEPVYPSLRLFPDAVSALFGDDADVSAMAHYSDKQRVAIQAASTLPDSPLPIGAIFLLSGDPDADAIAVRRPGAAQACIAALEQSFSLDPEDGARAAKRLAVASQLIENVETFELDYPNGYDRLDEVRGLIIACMKGDKSAQTQAEGV